MFLPSRLALRAVTGIRTIGLTLFGTTTTARTSHLLRRFKPVGLGVFAAGLTVIRLLAINFAFGH